MGQGNRQENNVIFWQENNVIFWQENNVIFCRTHEQIKLLITVRKTCQGKLACQYTGP
jgi:hypothetical protein